MADHYRTAIQAFPFLTAYVKPSSYRVTYRLPSVKALKDLNEKYDLFLLDRDCTLQEYHGKERAPEFEEVLREIDSKAEIISNSSLDEYFRIGTIFAGILPVNKLVRFQEHGEQPFLLHLNGDDLEIYEYNTTQRALLRVAQTLSRNQLSAIISYHYKKPNPLIPLAAIATHQQQVPSSKNLRTLLVGDRYLTDIVAGNLAGIDTALVRPYHFYSQTIDLIAMGILDRCLGAVMSRL